MRPGYIRKTALTAGIAIILVVASYFLWRPGYTLELSYADTHDILMALPLKKGESFSIRYMHSVDISPVVEVFSLNQEGRLQLDETRFKMFGAGFDHWKGHGILVKEGPWTKIKDIHLPLGSFILRVGSRGVDHTLLYRKQKINLSNVAAGKRILFSVTCQSRFRRWINRMRSSQVEN